MSLTGLILAGGQARRMQKTPACVNSSEDGAGVDKGLLMLRGEPLVAHAHRFLSPSVDKVLISANRNLDQYARYGEVVVDEPPMVNRGPLCGLVSAISRTQTEWLLVMPVDVCHIPPGFVQGLMDAITRSDALAAYAAALRPQPLCLIVHVSLADSLRESLLAGDCKVQSWHRKVGAMQVAFKNDPNLFFNINTPEDLAFAQSLPYASQCAKS